MSRAQLKAGQRGVAVIMALLLTTLAITIVASLFWQQQVQVRLIENQRLQLQKQWILRGALDWASLILREDAKHSSVDSLDEPWAAPLAETRLDQYVENGKADSDIADTTLSGSISDAQARFNLNNLVSNGKIDPLAINSFAKLLTLLNLNPEYALAAAKLMATATPFSNSFPTPTYPVNTLSSAMRSTNSLVPVVSPTLVPTQKNAVITEPQMLAFTQIQDLLSVTGITIKEITALKPYVTCLPNRTPVNFNTASAYVIAAVTPGLSLSEAQMLIASRTTASFRDLSDISNRLRGHPLNAAELSVTTNYFLIDGKVHMNRAQLDMQALLERNGTTSRIIWLREF